MDLLQKQNPLQRRSPLQKGKLEMPLMRKRRTKNKPKINPRINLFSGQFIYLLLHIPIHLFMSSVIVTSKNGKGFKNRKTTE